MAGQVLAVASGKGGVGKTTTVVNLGVVLRRADHTVVLVDADLGMANLGTMVGVEGDSTLHDVLAGTTSVGDAVVEEAPGFGVLAGSDDLSAYPDADPEALGPVLDTLAESYDYVIVDTGAGMSHEDVLPLGLADRVLLVTTPDPAAIGDTRKTAQLADLARGAISGVVVTMTDDSTDVADVARQVGVDLLGAIPFDPTVRRSTAAATPLEAVAPESQAAEAYRSLASVLVEGAPAVETAPPVAEPARATRGSGSVDDIDAATAEDDGVEPAEDGESADEEPVPAGDQGSEEPDDAGSEAAGGDHPSAAATEGADASDAADTDDAPAEGAVDPPSADEEESATDGEDDEAPVEAESEDDPADEPVSDGKEEGDADADDDLDEYLEDLEEVEPASSGGLFARLRRLLR